MNILYIGAGFVGTCSAAVSANSGHKNLVFDIDTDKIKKLNSQDRAIIEATLFEDGLGDLLIRNKERIDFTSAYGEVENFLNDCQAIFLCVPTPEIDATGESNLTYYFSALEKLSHSLVNRNKGKQTNYVVVVNKSTVPIDVIVQTEEVLEKAGVKNYGVVSNPEFLVEGKAIQESLKPDRIVIGAKKEQDFVVMRQIYQRFYDAPTVQYIEVGPEEAAAGKLLANFYLFNKLALCFDVLGRTCEAFDNLKIENIRRILTTDKRIGEWGFYDSLYAGGSCFIKDARSLAHQLQTKGYEATLVNETHLANKRQLELFIARATKEARINWLGKKVAVLGLSFKRDTNDIRNAPSIEVVNFLMEQSVEHISLYDPIANDVFKKQFPPSEKIRYSTNIDEAVQDAEVIIITTDWPQFRELAAQLMHLKNKPLLMDGRRMLQHRYNELQEMGFDIIAVGSPFIKGLTK